MSGWRGTTPPQMVSGHGVLGDKVKAILTNAAGKWDLNSEAVAVYTQPKHGVSSDDFLILDTGGHVLTGGGVASLGARQPEASGTIAWRKPGLSASSLLLNV